MMNKAIVRCMLAGTLAISVASPVFAQTALGGSKTPQNKIGGAAKPAPVIGGATIHTAPPKPGPTVATTKPGSPGGTPAAGTLGTTAGASRPNPPPPTTPNKGNKTANLKCASGACTTRGGKP